MSVEEGSDVCELGLEADTDNEGPPNRRDVEWARSLPTHSLRNESSTGAFGEIEPPSQNGSLGRTTFHEIWQTPAGSYDSPRELGFLASTRTTLSYKTMPHRTGIVPPLDFRGPCILSHQCSCGMQRPFERTCTRFFLADGPRRREIVRQKSFGTFLRLAQQFFTLVETLAFQRCGILAVSSLSDQ